jgi:hypothetical protein
MYAKSLKDQRCITVHLSAALAGYEMGENMSSKKIGVSVWIDKFLLMKVDDESAEVNRSRSNLLEQILKERYESKAGSTKGEKQNGNEA